MRPPFPANKGGGLYSEPTVINNVETLTNVPWIIINGAEEYKKIGTEQSPGTKIFCLSGHINKPGNYELPLGTTFRELIFEYGGGIPDGKAIKAILPSGGSGPIVHGTDEVLDTKLTYEDMAKIGTILGSASVIVMDETVDIAWVASKAIKFFKHESCGKCTPCREGTYWLDKVLDRIMRGEAKESDIDLDQQHRQEYAGRDALRARRFRREPGHRDDQELPGRLQGAHTGEQAEEKAAPKGCARRGGAARRRGAAASAGD